MASKNQPVAAPRKSRKTVVRKPSSKGSCIVRKGNLLVYTGAIPEGYDILKAIDQDREEQMRKA
jgi:hypothetical protein